jgi:hypothetical protein
VAKRTVLTTACAVLLAGQIVLASSSELRRQNNISFTPKPAVLTAKDPRKFNDLDKAYLDAFVILREDNACSRLYGGPNAIEALDELVRMLRPTHIDRTIALRMSGPTTMIENGRTGFSFRLFEKAEVNLNGSFYRSNTYSNVRVPLVANYQPNTRKSRLALLLHELGHLVRGADRKWVLADDGQNADLSLRNTDYVVDVCRDQIESVTRMTVAQQLEEPHSTIAQTTPQP